MKFSLFDLICAMCLGAMLTYVVYDNMLTRSIALVQSQQELVKQQGEINTHCLDTLSQIVDDSVLVRIVNKGETEEE